MSTLPDVTKPVNHPVRPVCFNAVLQCLHNREIIIHGVFLIWVWVGKVHLGIPAAPLLLAGFSCFKARLRNALLAAVVPLCEYLYQNMTFPSPCVIEMWSQQQDAESQLWPSTRIPVWISCLPRTDSLRVLFTALSLRARTADNSSL